MLQVDLSEVSAGSAIKAVGFWLRGRIPMAQAVATSTDDLLSQLAANEIDRLLAEAENGAPAPKEAPPAPPVQAKPPEEKEEPKTPEPTAAAEGPEREALLKAAGFEDPKPEAAAPAPPPEAPAADERSAILQAAGFESVDAQEDSKASESEELEDPNYVPIFLKPLVWINSPLNAYPSIARKMLGSAGIVTLLNALAVLMYVFFFRKH
jgi:outer membrane biosynthesis protein TonB